MTPRSAAGESKSYGAGRDQQDQRTRRGQRERDDQLGAGDHPDAQRGGPITLEHAPLAVAGEVGRDADHAHGAR